MDIEPVFTSVALVFEIIGALAMCAGFIEGVLPWRRALLTSGGQMVGEAIARDRDASRDRTDRGSRF